MVDTTSLQVRTHRDPGLPGSDYQGINLNHIHT